MTAGPQQPDPPRPHSATAWPAAVPDAPPGGGGLTSAEAARRLAASPADPGEHTSRPVSQILRANILTRFNLILGALLVVILVLGEPQDTVFGVVLVTNMVVGIAQELRAKLTLDRLAVLTAPRVRVVRDGAAADITVAGLVTGDLVRLRPGDQLVADGVVADSAGLEADESLLTGEPDPVGKQPGDQLMSGSFVVAGTGGYLATGVGADSYARRLAAEARRFTLVRSELLDGINRILRYIMWGIPALAALSLISQLHAGIGVPAALTGTVAAVVGIVPQGLVLLTSIAFGVSAVSLARRRVLVQQLPAVEGLARVDVVCFDKTGTLTDGTVRFDELVDAGDQPAARAALGALAAGQDGATMAAIGQAFGPPGWQVTSAVPFSSARKWSAASFAGRGSWVLGAPEVVLAGGSPATLRRAAGCAATGRRVLALARTDAPLAGGALPPGLRPAGLILLSERVRPGAREAIRFFAAQGIALKAISGDSPATVAAVAASAGLAGAGAPVDARDLPEDTDALGAVLEERSVFGRVAPHQKQAMVRALQARGHVVAMTGDGVNDVLALKLADVGVAMGAGAAATRAVAELVLLDEQFTSLPAVVAEGRRVMANIERVAGLFITKSVWAAALALVAGAALLPFPFLPRHLTFIDSFTIGIPSFFLALAPNRRRYRPGFIGRVLRFAIPAGLIIGAAALGADLLARAGALPLVQQRTAATLVTVLLGLCVLVLASVPLTWPRLVLVAAAACGFAALFRLPLIQRVFELELPSPRLAGLLPIGAGGLAALIVSWLILRRRRARADASAGEYSPGN